MTFAGFFCNHCHKTYSVFKQTEAGVLLCAVERACWSRYWQRIEDAKQAQEKFERKVTRY